MKIYLYIIVLSGFPLFVLGNLPNDPNEYAEWERSMLAGIEQRVKSPPEISIQKLGSVLSQVSNGANLEKGQRPVFYAAQSALLSIPGHAKYYQEQIHTARELAKKNEDLPQEEQWRLQRAKQWVGLGAYEETSRNAFMVLAHLPSPETVTVLGHFLEDPVGRDGKDLLGNPYNLGGDYVRQLPNCGLAYATLTQLEIAGAPTVGSDRNTGEYFLDPLRVDSWKEWWSEVKSGRKTFSFKGQSVEYRFKPDGTWDTIPIANPPDDGAKPVAAGPESREVRENPSVSLRAPASQFVTHTPWRWLTAGLALVFAVLGFLLWKGRRKPAG